LEIANLHGDIVGTASYSETATELATKADTSEFGAPTLSLPPKYSWLGSIELATEELPSGAIDMGARSYVPEIGRFLQPDPISGGSANAYSYTFGDPVNSSDASGEFTFVASYVNAFDEEMAAGAAERGAIRIAAEEAERRAAEEAAARVAAEIAAEEAAWEAEWAAGPQYGEEEWWEEESGYEFIASPAEKGREGNETHLESAVLYQPLVDSPPQTESGRGTVPCRVEKSESETTSKQPCTDDVREWLDRKRPIYARGGAIDIWGAQAEAQHAAEEQAQDNRDHLNEVEAEGQAEAEAEAYEDEP
jgi:RHS repeat-associated protein